MTDSTNDASGSPLEDGLGPLHDQISEKLDQLWPKNVRSAAVGTLAVGHRIAQYKIRAFLGSGSFGIVYLADDTIEGHPVALKLPRLEVLCNGAKRKRFAAEAALAVGLDHPGIVKVLAWEVDGPTPYIASVWCDGGDLGSWMNQHSAEHSPLPQWQDVAKLIADVADAVQYAHEKGVVHRDLKPANILLSRKFDGASDEPTGLGDFRAKVADFGLAKMNDPSIVDTQSSLLVGTPIYMAPEQFYRSGEIPSFPAAVDIYSLGAILFELLTGESPIEGETYFEVLSNIRSEPPQRVSQFRKRLPPDLNVICSTCLHKNPLARYDSAAQLSTDLRQCISGGRVTGKSINVFRRSKFWFGRQDWFSIAGWFAIGSQTLVTIWLILSDLFKVSFGLLTMQEYLALLPQLILIAIVTSFSTILLGGFTIRRKRWAAWGGVLLSAFNLSAPVVALVNRPMIFDQIYDATDPYFSFKVHLILLLCFSCQLILFLCAAWPKKRTK